jgi:osmotically-inducible protein OsmY
MLCTEKEIKTVIVNQISKAPGIGGSQIYVSFDSGTVILKGFVGEYGHRDKVENFVSELPEVLDVKNELIVIPSEKIDDEIIAQKIIDELKAHDHLEISNFLIEVSNGVITLAGTAPDLASKVYVYVAAAQASNVLNIVDNLDVSSR